jgi:hypothetical protein
MKNYKIVGRKHVSDRCLATHFRVCSCRGIHEFKKWDRKTIGANVFVDAPIGGRLVGIEIEGNGRNRDRKGTASMGRPIDSSGGRQQKILGALHRRKRKHLSKTVVQTENGAAVFRETFLRFVQRVFGLI